MKWFFSVILLLLVSCGEDEKYEEVEFDLGYKGAARVNPYLAAERFLKTGGWEVSSSRVWSDFDAETAPVNRSFVFILFSEAWTKPKLISWIRSFDPSKNPNHGHDGHGLRYAVSRNSFLFEYFGQGGTF